MSVLVDEKLKTSTVLELLNSGYKRKDLVKKIERVVRLSPEYQEWAKKKKQEIGHCEWAGCVFQDEKAVKFTELEVHHYPQTLFSLIDELLDDFLERTPLELAQYVVDLHTSGAVPVLVLCHCHHWQFHKLRSFGLEPDPSIPMEEFIREITRKDKDVPRIDQ